MPTQLLRQVGPQAEGAFMRFPRGAHVEVRAPGRTARGPLAALVLERVGVFVANPAGGYFYAVRHPNIATLTVNDAGDGTLAFEFELVGVTFRDGDATTGPVVEFGVPFRRAPQVQFPQGTVAAVEAAARRVAQATRTTRANGMPRARRTITTTGRTAVQIARTSATTRERLVALRREFPAMTGAQLARLLKVSRERVRQLLVMEKLPTRVEAELRGGWQAKVKRKRKRLVAAGG